VAIRASRTPSGLMQTPVMSKWQGTVEIGFVIPYIDESEHHLRRLEVQDMDGDYLFDILPSQDGCEGVCREAGQTFVLSLGWNEYDQMCGRMKGSSIRIDLSGIDLG